MLSDSTPAEHRQALQNEFDQCQRKMALAKRRLNTYTLVACFPSEVLINIFSHYQHLTREAEGDSEGRHEGRPYLWIKVTHVCFFWRHASISAPELWTRISVTNAACVKEMFKRVRGAKLSLKVTMSPLIDDHKTLQSRITITQRCLAILQRFTSVDVLAGDTQDLADLFRSANNPGQLQKLILSVVGLPGMPEPLYEGTPIPFIKKSMPHLRHLQYQGANFQWTETALRPSLTHVDIRNTQPAGVAGFTVTQFVRALQTMPLLQSLTLVDVFASNQAECRASPPIKLPALQSLRIDGSVKHCANLLDCIAIPHDASVSFTVDGDIPFSRLITVLATRLATSGKALKSVAITRRDSYTGSIFIALHGWTSIRALTAKHTPANLTLSLDVRRQNSIVKATEQLCTELPLNDVRTLRVDNISLLSKAFWTKLASQMPALRGVRLKGHAAEGFPETLASKPLLPSKLQTSASQARFAALYFPRLHTILLDEVPFEMTNAQNHSFLRRLNTVIGVRRNRGTIRKVMILQGVDIVMDEVLDMKKIVPILQWDGYELTFDDNEEVFDQFAGVGGKRGDDIEDEAAEYES
ncbi:hypothetical protein EUX98_g4964 [Antrodiella citrinella]|uniref:Uncharacterized protein n=1 Tax=Antrodiella citrinella TaxID=2447956 RepID=A0A4S4MV54_9APHY|nr:hypothetical protein EUX98_g4964 [Antrodiella citrinella]